MGKKKKVKSRKKIMNLQTFLELFTAKYNIQTTLSDGTKFYLKGTTII